MGSNKFVKYSWYFLSEIITALLWGFGMISNIIPFIPSIENPVFWGATFFFTLFVVEQSVVSKISLLNETPNIIVKKTYTDEQFVHSRHGLICKSYARVRFCNNPLNNSKKAVASDTYARLYYFDKDLNQLLDRGLFGRWGVSSDLPSPIMTHKEIRELHKVTFEPSGLYHDLDVAHMNEELRKIYGFDYRWFTEMPDISKEYFLSKEECYLVVYLHGTRIEKPYYFKLWADDENKVRVKEIGWSKKCKKTILKKLQKKNEKKRE